MSTTGIKIDPRFKGKWHYEEYLLEKHRKEIWTYLLESGYPRQLKKLIKQLYEIYMNKENIIQVYTHPPNEFISHLCHGTLGLLGRYTSIRTLKIGK